MYYNKQGIKLTMDEYIVLMSNEKYKRIDYTTLSDGRIVSTVWLGLDHNYEKTGEPLIFETMVFPSSNEYAETECVRYATEEEAIKGHKEMVAKHRKLIVEESTDKQVERWKKKNMK